MAIDLRRSGTERFSFCDSTERDSTGDVAIAIIPINRAGYTEERILGLVYLKRVCTEPKTRSGIDSLLEVFIQPVGSRLCRFVDHDLLEAAFGVGLRPSAQQQARRLELVAEIGENPQFVFNENKQIIDSMRHRDRFAGSERICSY